MLEYNPIVLTCALKFSCCKKRMLYRSHSDLHCSAAKSAALLSSSGILATACPNRIKDPGMVDAFEHVNCMFPCSFMVQVLIEKWNAAIITYCSVFPSGTRPAPVLVLLICLFFLLQRVSLDPGAVLAWLDLGHVLADAVG